MLHFDAMSGKSASSPFAMISNTVLFEYLYATGLRGAPKDAPFFRTAYRKTGTLTETSLSGWTSAGWSSAGFTPRA